MLPAIITASDRIDALYTVDAQVRSSIAKGLQASYILACDIDRSGREAVRFWQEFLPALSNTLDEDYREAKWTLIELFDSIVNEVAINVEVAKTFVMPVVEFAIAMWVAYNEQVDTLVASCEKTEEEVIAEQIEELGIAHVEMLRTFSLGFIEVFGAVEPVAVRQEVVAKGKVNGYRSMSKEVLATALR